MCGHRVWPSSACISRCHGCVPGFGWRIWAARAEGEAAQCGDDDGAGALGAPEGLLPGGGTTATAVSFRLLHRDVAASEEAAVGPTVEAAS